MKLLQIDANGTFVGDVILDKRPTIFTEQKDDKGKDIEVEIFDPLYRVESPPEGLYRPKWDFDNNKWVEGLSQADIDALKNVPKPKTTKDDVKLLQAQINALNKQNEFYEELIYELAMKVYV